MLFHRLLERKYTEIFRLEEKKYDEKQDWNLYQKVEKKTNITNHISAQ